MPEIAGVRMGEPLTKAQRRALEILEEIDDWISPYWFAKKMWPDSPSWSTHSNIGLKGSTTGVGIWQKAGSHLSSLVRRGWVRVRFTRHHAREYRLSSVGKEALRG